MKVIDLLNSAKTPTFSFELLPPLKGNSIERVFGIIDRLRQFDPKYINITSHHSEPVYKTDAIGNVKKSNLRKRPGSVAIAAAIQNKYGITAVPHIICKGFTKEETEYALIDLSFLEVHDLLLLQGDAKKIEINPAETHLYHDYASGLIGQVNNFNNGIDLDGESFEKPRTPFSYGVAGYPEKHEAAPDPDSDIHYLKQKAALGADYIVTQMFFDNEKYFAFVDRCRSEGITIPILPGVKPVVLKSQLEVLPQIFKCDIPEEFAHELRKCQTDDEAKAVGVEWGIKQCRDLLAKGVPGIHFYSLMATESIYKIAKEVY